MNSPHTDESPLEDLEHIYDEMPYQSDPHYHSQPARIAAAAQLMGLSAPDVRCARVLELGCASGGNLIPLAAQYPDAQFLGIDISGIQITQGKTRIQDLGLQNIELRKCSIDAISLADGFFDYILSHGVYSWVPHEIREALMRVLSENLRDDGIAYVSYNVYPGWHPKTVTRDLLLYHREYSKNTESCIAESKQMLADIGRYATGSYASVLNNEANLINNVHDSYIRHEHLEPYNHPVYFRDFVLQAQCYGLRYLCESDPVTSIPECMHPEIANKVRALAGNDIIKLEQYLDFYIGRQFRSTLLVKQERAALINRVIRPERMRNLHIHCRSPFIKMVGSSKSTISSICSGFAIFKNEIDSLTVHSSLHVRALEALERHTEYNPATITTTELAIKACMPHEPTEEDICEVDGLLLELLRRGVVSAYSVAIESRAVSAKPKTRALAIDDARKGRPATTSLIHAKVSFINEFARQCLPLLDGTHDHEMLEQAMIKLFKEGKIQLEEHDRVLPITEDPTNAIRTGIAIALASYARLHMLEG